MHGAGLRRQSIHRVVDRVHLDGRVILRVDSHGDIVAAREWGRCPVVVLLKPEAKHIMSTSCVSDFKKHNPKMSCQMWDLLD